MNPLIQKSIAVVTKLRHDAVGWDDPVYKGRGRPPKRGKKWKLAELWKQCPHQKVTAHMYGKTVEVAAVVRDVWLRNVEEKVRVVVVEGTKRPILLISTELTFTAKQIIEIYAARFSLEIAIRDLKQSIGFCDYQSITTVAFLRFTQLCCVAFCIGRLILWKKEAISWLKDSSPSPVNETAYSFSKLRRGLRRFVLKRLLFSKFASDADLEKREKELEPIFRIAA